MRGREGDVGGVWLGEEDCVAAKVHAEGVVWVERAGVLVQAEGRGGNLQGHLVREDSGVEAVWADAVLPVDNAAELHTMGRGQMATVLEKV